MPELKQMLEEVAGYFESRGMSVHLGAQILDIVNPREPCAGIRVASVEDGFDVVLFQGGHPLSEETAKRSARAVIEAVNAVARAEDYAVEDV